MFAYSEGPYQRFSVTRSRIMGSAAPYGVAYPSPFFDVAHTYLPDTIKRMFRWCRYYYLTNPVIAATINKMAEYPVTDITVATENDGLRAHWETFFDDTLQLRSFLVDMGLYYQCFHGDTKVVTDVGVFKIRDMIGETYNVLSKGGAYRPARFKSYGRQRLLEVEFSDGSTVLTTPGHKWLTVTSRGHTLELPTTEIEGRSVPRNVAPRPEQGEEFYEGVRHGFVFGDGTLYNKGTKARAYFCGRKDQMIKHFEGHGSPPRREKNVNRSMIHGLPSHYKTLPDNGASAEYWYGFVSGFLAADGSVDVHGCVVLTQHNRATLEVISDQLPRIGMVSGPLRGQWRRSDFGEGEMFYLTILKQSMLPQDLLLSHHRERFEENFNPSNYGKCTTVRAVRETGIVDEVYCCEEDETHTFTIGNGVLTGNCYGNAIVSIHYPFVKFLRCRYCGKKHPVRDVQYRFHGYRFVLSCPSCGNTGDAAAEDVHVKSPRQIKLILWNPEDIVVVHNDVTGEDTYFYEVPKALQNDIQLGKPHVVQNIPQLVIDAVRKEKMIRLNADNIYHARRPSLLTGVKDAGMGIPMLLPVLKDTFYLQILKKANETIALERVYPLSVVFPQSSSPTADVFNNVSLTKWRDQVQQEIARWRIDRAYIPIMPLPLGHQVIGGDGRALMLSQEIKIWSDQIIAGMGVPNEFVYGGLQWSGSNVSLRMLENHFLRYISDQRRFVRTFLIKNVAAYLGWPEVEARFKPFKMADDLQRKALLFQYNQSGKISDATLLTDSDLEPYKENETMERETSARMAAVKKQQLAQAEIQGEAQVVMARYQARSQSVMMMEQQKSQQGTQDAGPGEAREGMGAQQIEVRPTAQASAPPPQASPDPRAVQQLVQQLAQMDPGFQQMALQQIAQQNPTLAQAVATALRSAGPSAPASASKPLPEQLPPRRGPEAAAI